MGKVIFFVAFICCVNSVAQDITGIQLLEKSIKYHDPHNSWKSFNGDFTVTMESPKGDLRISEISLNLPQQYFELSTIKEKNTILQILDKGICTLNFNGKTEISKEDKATYRINCKRATTMKNYYSYLYGLPMKLKDSGTIIDSVVKTKTFKGKTYLVLKATYEKEVGKDIWYFYFNPNTYAMEVYQFFHDEVKNDGEYILLTGEETIQGVKMPKVRAWYYNNNDGYLGTDILSRTN
ncbi:MAG: DUF6503 family protein [Cellulophaga sp.]